LLDLLLVIGIGNLQAWYAVTVQLANQGLASFWTNLEAVCHESKLSLVLYVRK